MPPKKSVSNEDKSTKKEPKVTKKRNSKNSNDVSSTELSSTDTPSTNVSSTEAPISVVSSDVSKSTDISSTEAPISVVSSDVSKSTDISSTDVSSVVVSSDEVSSVVVSSDEVSSTDVSSVVVSSDEVSSTDVSRTDEIIIEKLDNNNKNVVNDNTKDNIKDNTKKRSYKKSNSKKTIVENNVSNLFQTDDEEIENVSKKIVKFFHEDNLTNDNNKCTDHEIKSNNDEKENISKTEVNDTINNIINDLVLENSNVNKYVLNENIINNILEDYPVPENYTFTDLKNIFSQFEEAVMLIQILDGNIKFIEKKGYETRNQSVIELLIKANQYKRLPSISFLIFTNDFIESEPLREHSFLYTFCKNNTYNTVLFPNFNFNHWVEANIGNYEIIYNFFKNNQKDWNSKKNTIFWSGADTNTIRNKMFLNTLNNPLYEINLTNITKNRYPITNIIKYKYLLNMNGHSYSGRLNYLFLSGSCVIQLKNKDPLKSFEEFYYKHFIPDVDYIEILYDDDMPVEDILLSINNKLNVLNCEIIAQNGYKKAVEIFNINNIYEYIYDTLSINSSKYITTKNSSLETLLDTTEKKKISSNTLEQSIMYIPSKNIYSNRINIEDNSIHFLLKGNDILVTLINDSKNKFTIYLFNNTITSLFNGKILLKTTLYKDINKINYKIYNSISISLKNNNLTIKFNNNQVMQLPTPLFNIVNTEISSSNSCWIIY
jgi:hypothetical protein